MSALKLLEEAEVKELIKEYANAARILLKGMGWKGAEDYSDLLAIKRLILNSAAQLTIRATPQADINKAAGEAVALPFVVQYRRKDDGVAWHPMAAFDFQSPAESYAKFCSGDQMPWEYRVVDISDAPLPPLPEDK